MKFGYGECYEADWVIENTSPMCIEEKYRKYLPRVIMRGGYRMLSEFTDNEVRAVAMAIEYNVSLLETLVKDYPKGHKSMANIKLRIEILKKAHKRLAGFVEL